MTTIHVYVLLGLLAAIAVLLGIIAWRLRHGAVELSMMAGIEEAMERLGQQTQHYTKVNAVLALVERFRENPKSLDRLPLYSRQVVAAAQFSWVNSLGSQIETVHEQLTNARDKEARGNYASREGETERLHKLSIALRAELAAAHRAVLESGNIHAY